MHLCAFVSTLTPLFLQFLPPPPLILPTYRTPSNNQQGKYVGMLDIRDLIAFIVFENSEGEALRKVPGLEGSTEFIDRLLGAGARMCVKLCSNSHCLGSATWM